MFQMLLIIAVLFSIELIYFKIADQFNIIDKPNERSSHTQITIRGGGILFPIAWIFYSIVHGFVFPYCTIGMLFVATISFLDDRMDISSRLRLLIHVIAFTLCFYELHLFSMLPWWAILIAYIVSIGCVNAINFMDGINGMTGLYGLSILVPISIYFFGTTLQDHFVMYMIWSILVFGFFNFRKKAKCFAGDVGSVSLGYFLIFLILGFMFHCWQVQGNHLLLANKGWHGFEFKYILFLTLYGLDSILTIAQRLYLKENIFKPHRKHLYQLLANEMKIPHLWVSILYALVQTLISGYLLTQEVTTLRLLSILLIGVIGYIGLKWMLIKKIAQSMPNSY
jgi:UDP-N-acetylmuramyl pentapeptide phosphotransferase/UDP-N-acetylglucosamine-1-phosphate transferase